MCGILWHFKNRIDRQPTAQNGKCDLNDPLFEQMVPLVCSRGLDSTQYFKKEIAQGTITEFSSVLSIRAPLTLQPMIRGNFTLQYNGELYNQEIENNDLEFIYQTLVKSNFDVVSTIGQLDGEFSYCITNTDTKKVFFGKDLLGRKSLGYMLDENQLYISSCPPATKQDTWIECACATIYEFDMESGKLITINFESSNNLPSPDIVQQTDEPLNLVNLHKLLASSVRKRVRTISPTHKSSSSVALLFSGGLDCTLVAALAASELGPDTTIDLLNVSFCNPRSNTKPADTPDRLLAIKSWKGLQQMFSKVKFQLVEIDVPYEEYLEHRSKVIQLIYPNDTEMDLSIAIAFYFAARGIGNRVLPNGTREPYESTCRVLLSGLGADELFGGYTRHERIFTSLSNQIKRRVSGKPPKDTTEYNWDTLIKRLIEELQLDLSNLHIRNLSRDDKVISCWSKEVRYPFLDKSLVEFATRKVRCEDKLRLDRTTGEIIRKFALRELARHLGLEFVEQEPKRAIQFGSRSAKIDPGTGKVKGTDRLV
ncbi:hypothetical protein OGATHE_000840 [Ogataea polymorpha]|uniref:Glutamine amidotransferase type-2 domain-containing protein n=1 Tax=Ogataea polymorpha TaxID=460523 RepID=A0A9P8PSB2_9ASCO|nr:hypothetical protein OGATHE_000840 [Ogataea polymorpha]